MVESMGVNTCNQGVPLPTYAIVMPNLFGLFVETSHTIVQNNDSNLIKY